MAMEGIAAIFMVVTARTDDGESADRSSEDRKVEVVACSVGSEVFAAAAVKLELLRSEVAVTVRVDSMVGDTLALSLLTGPDALDDDKKGEDVEIGPAG